MKTSKWMFLPVIRVPLIQQTLNVGDPQVRSITIPTKEKMLVAFLWLMMIMTAVLFGTYLIGLIFKCDYCDKALDLFLRLLTVLFGYFLGVTKERE